MATKEQILELCGMADKKFVINWRDVGMADFKPTYTQAIGADPSGEFEFSCVDHYGLTTRFNASTTLRIEVYDKEASVTL